jgi:hypothetical protein
MFQRSIPSPSSALKIETKCASEILVSTCEFTWGKDHNHVVTADRTEGLFSMKCRYLLFHESEATVFWNVLLKLTIWAGRK